MDVNVDDAVLDRLRYVDYCLERMRDGDLSRAVEAAQWINQEITTRCGRRLDDDLLDVISAVREVGEALDYEDKSGEKWTETRVRVARLSALVVTTKTRVSVLAEFARRLSDSL